MKIIGIAGWSGAGKTTLIARLIPILRAKGVSVSTIKHAHHAFDIDVPGKDSYIHREAGAREVIVTSMHRWALMHEHRGDPEPALEALLGRLAPVDLVLAEGFKREAHDKIEVHRVDNAKPFLFPDDPRIVAVASDAPPPFGPPCVSLDDIEAIATLVLAQAVPFHDVRRRLSEVRPPGAGP